MTKNNKQLTIGGVLIAFLLVYTYSHKTSEAQQESPGSALDGLQLVQQHCSRSQT